MSEDIKAGINEILDDVDQLPTEEYIEDVTLWDLVLESVSEVVEDRIINGDVFIWHGPEILSFSKKDEVVDCLSNLLYVNTLFHDGESFSESGQSVDDTHGEFIMLARGSGKQSRINESSFEAQMINLSKTGQSVAEWVEKTYGVSPITGDSTTDLTLLFTDTTEEPVRPRKRGERCDACSNMTKKELKRYDSCPECGRSLFALKGRGW